MKIPQPFEVPVYFKFILCVTMLISVCSMSHAESTRKLGGQQIEVSLPASVSARPVTGRLFVALCRRPDDPALRMRSLGHQPIRANVGMPFFGIDVEQLRPGQSVVIDDSTLGYPIKSFRDLPAGEYFAKAIFNIYTKFHREDGHVIWAHMDKWEGQHFNFSPGNLVSKVTRVHLDPASENAIKLTLDDVIHLATSPEDTVWVKRVKLKSQLLSKFWGRPIYLGAVVLLPKDYEQHGSVHYPTVYCQGHFSLRPPLGFRTDQVEETPDQIARRKARGLENGYEFYRNWVSKNFPRMICVTFQHPTPYFDDSYAVNSVNNGPYADALLEELIPHLEKKFRMVPKGYARILTGGSTGGYESMALQVHHPKTFGGAWIFYPDPVDFRRVFQVNIYEDDNAFKVPGFGGLRPERIAFRSRDGQPIQSIRQLSRLQLVMGSSGRSGDYLNAWEAAFGPIGTNGYPKPLWDKTTGKIDPSVAKYWRDNGYDLTHYLRTRWPQIGNDLEGKLHLYVGDMDNYYFNLSVMLAQETLEGLKNPPYGGSVQLGSPLKAHGWHPMNNSDLLRIMARHITQRAPNGEDTKQWKY